MTPEPFEYEPLENLFRGIESESEETNEAELKRSLRERGLDPDKTTDAVSAKVSEFLKRQRLSWQEVAKEKQAKLQAAAARVVSWTTRKKEEIEAAFADVQGGKYGSAAQMQLQAAHRNLSSISLQDKATFLDEIDTLRQLKASEPPPDQES